MVEVRPIMSAEYRLALLAKTLQRGLSAIAELLVIDVFDEPGTGLLCSCFVK